MGLFNKNKSNIIKCPVLYLDGLSTIVPQSQCIIYLNDNHLIIEVMDNNQKFELSFSQITHIEQNFHQKILEKQKSVLKRSIIGSALLGTTGAIVGGMSGIGNKEITLSVYDLFVVYKTSNTNEINTIIFRSLNHKICQKIVDDIKSNMPKEEINIKL